MKYENLNLAGVEINTKAKGPQAMMGLSDEELHAFASKMASVTKDVHDDKLETTADVLEVLLPKLTAKEAALLIYTGTESGIIDALEKAEDPLHQLAFLMSQIGKKKQEAAGK